MITVQMIGAFVVGVIIPLVMALLGKESLGKWLVGKQQREDTALSALISLAQESISGWRESNVAVLNLSSSMREHSEHSDRRLSDATNERDSIKQAIDKSSERLTLMESRLSTLVQLLGDAPNGE